MTLETGASLMKPVQFQQHDRHMHFKNFFEHFANLILKVVKSCI